MRFLQKFFIIPITRASELITQFFDTAPDLMSDKTAEKLKDKDEAKKLIQEIRTKRSPDYSTSH